MKDQETRSPKKGPNCERIAGQAFALVDAEKRRIAHPTSDAKKAVTNELRKLAVVVDEERKS